ncbi:energy transducer TonB [Neisseriaceae bacterium JH1-16]|nr:energy transducer TonB [Neisseriaceae bacterium JH1-16]
MRSGYLDNPPPEYPVRSRELGEQGRVELKVKVGRDGRPLEVQIARSSGFTRLDRAAQQAVTQWRFVPAREGDSPVESWLIVPMPFRLN